MNLQRCKHVQDTLRFAFCKNALGIFGPYSETLWINQYRVPLIDMYSGWLKTFSIPNDKEVQTIVHLFVDEMIPRFGVPLQ